jgi:tRNA threonylcarbamoyladenosine biosynthesis protein TsaE
METLHIADEHDLSELAETVLTEIRAKKRKGHASVLALSGDLGAGKTTFMKVFAQKLGIKEDVTSPTFVVMKRYDIADTHMHSFSHLYHLDLYRIEDTRELSPLALSRILKEDDALVALEWAERAEDLLPVDTIRVHFGHGATMTARTVTLS